MALSRDGQLAGRVLKALAVAGEPMAARAYAESRGWHDVATTIKAMSLGDQPALADANLDFLSVHVPMTALGKLGARRVPLRTRGAMATGDAVAAFVAEGGLIPAALPEFELGDVLDPRTVAGLYLVTEELAAANGIEDRLGHVLARALALEMDRQLLDPANDGSGAVPASITNSVVPVSSMTDAIGAVVEAGGDLNRMAWVVTAPAYPVIPFVPGATLVEGDIIAPTGGRLLGLPFVVASGAVPNTDSPPTGRKLIALVDRDALVYGDDGVDLLASRQAMVAVGSGPAERAVSCWQENLVTLRGTRRINWSVLGGRTAWVDLDA